MYYQFLTVVKPVHKSFIVLSFQMPTIALFFMNSIAIVFAMSLMLSNYNNPSSDIRHKGELGYKRLCPIKVLGRIGDFEIFRIFQIFIRLYPPVWLIKKGPLLASFVFLCYDPQLAYKMSDCCNFNQVLSRPNKPKGCSLVELK